MYPFDTLSVGSEDLCGDPYGPRDDVTRSVVDTNRIHDALGFRFDFGYKRPTVEAKVRVPPLRAPSVPEFLRCTSYTVQTEPQEIVNTILQFFAELELRSSVFNREKFELCFLAFVEGVASVKFTVRLYSTKDGDHVVELVRDDGCCLRFAQVFNSLKEQLQNSAPTLLAFSPHIPELSEDDEEPEWDWIFDEPVDVSLVLTIGQKCSPLALDALREKMIPKLAEIICNSSPADVVPLCALVELLLAGAHTDVAHENIMEPMMALYGRSNAFAQRKCAHMFH